MIPLFEALSTKLNDVHWHGRYFSAQCPFHDDHEPSLLVYPDGCFCLGERRRYSLQVVERKIKGQPTRPTEWKSAYRFNWRDTPDPETMADDGYRALHRQPALMSYLKERGLNADFIRQALIGWWDGWYTFPIYGAEGNFRGLIIRASPAVEKATRCRYLTPPGQPDMLYSPDWTLWHSLEKLRNIFIVYGIFDALLLSQLGLSCLTSTFGQKLSSELLATLRCPITILPDDHPHEIQSARLLAASLGWRGKAKVLKYPKGIKDPAGFWPNHVKELTCQIL